MKLNSTSQSYGETASAIYFIGFPPQNEVLLPCLHSRLNLDCIFIYLHFSYMYVRVERDHAKLCDYKGSPAISTIVI